MIKKPCEGEGGEGSCFQYCPSRNINNILDLKEPSL